MQRPHDDIENARIADYLRAIELTELGIGLASDGITARRLRCNAMAEVMRDTGRAKELAWRQSLSDTAVLQSDLRYLSSSEQRNKSFLLKMAISRQSF